MNFNIYGYLVMHEGSKSANHIFVDRLNFNNRCLWFVYKRNEIQRSLTSAVILG